RQAEAVVQAGGGAGRPGGEIPPRGVDALALRQPRFAGPLAAVTLDPDGQVHRRSVAIPSPVAAGLTSKSRPDGSRSRRRAGRSGAAGTWAARAMAASRSSASQPIVPAIEPWAPRNGPSDLTVDPLRTRTVVASAGSPSGRPGVRPGARFSLP